MCSRYQVLQFLSLAVVWYQSTGYPWLLQAVGYPVPAAVLPGAV